LLLGVNVSFGPSGLGHIRLLRGLAPWAALLRRFAAETRDSDSVVI